jgi:heme/copper-type cytochrome/quinol oxidase subunit 3
LLAVEDWAEIRRLHRAEGLPIKMIARTLGMSRNTVRTALASDGPPVVTADRVKPRRLGVDGVWIAIGADSVIFAILFGSFMQARVQDPGVFEASRHTLNMNLGGIDTLILLTSSWAVALAI